MIKRFWLIILLIPVTSSTAEGQETNYGPGYQTIFVNNPAFTGSGGDGTMRISYLNFYPGHSYNFHSVYFGYDSYFPVLHGGAGIFIADDYLGGILNDFRAGLSYSYFLQAGREFYIYAGLSASVFHRGFDFRGAVLPEQIDHMGGISIPPSEILNNESRSVLDIGTGFLFIYRNYFGGFGITHLTQPDLGGSGSAVERIKRKYFFSVAAGYEIDNRDDMMIRPILSAELQEKFFSLAMGALLETSSLSVNTQLFYNNNRNLDVQAGFSLSKGTFAFFYNYKFSLKSGNSLMPFSLVHQTGLIFSLNSVEKRFKVRTINIPRL